MRVSAPNPGLRTCVSSGSQQLQACLKSTWRNTPKCVSPCQALTILRWVRNNVTGCFRGRPIPTDGQDPPGGTLTGPSRAAPGEATGSAVHS
jgi:hypothetical protein